jgi:hypothetical protein
MADGAPGRDAGITRRRGRYAHDPGSVTAQTRSNDARPPRRGIVEEGVLDPGGDLGRSYRLRPSSSAGGREMHWRHLSWSVHDALPDVAAMAKAAWGVVRATGANHATADRPRTALNKGANGVRLVGTAVRGSSGTLPQSPAPRRPGRPGSPGSPGTSSSFTSSFSWRCWQRSMSSARPSPRRPRRPPIAAHSAGNRQ